MGAIFFGIRIQSFAPAQEHIDNMTNLSEIVLVEKPYHTIMMLLRILG